MIISAAQPLSIRRQGSTEYDFTNLLGGGILNGYIVQEGDRVLVEKRGGFVVDTSLGLGALMGANDYICGAGSSYSGAASIALWDDSATDVLWIYGGSSKGAIGTSAPTYKVCFDMLDNIPIALRTSIEIAASPSSETLGILTGGSLTLDTSHTNQPTNICWGTVVLAGRLYLGNNNSYGSSRIYNSAEGDPGTWPTTDFITVDRSSDNLRAIGKHKDCIAAFGRSSVEFFYLNPDAPATGSTLRRREDVFYSIGIYSINSIADLGDMKFFVGGIAQGVFHTRYRAGVYVLDNFQIRKISTDAVDAFLADTDAEAIFGSTLAVTTSGRPLYLLTKNIDSTTGDVTLAYDVEKDFWYMWAYGSGDSFKIVAQMDFDALGSQPSFIMRDGTILRGSTNEVFQDNSTNYKFAIRTNSSAYGMGSKRKFFPEFSVVGDYCTTGSWSVRVSDDDFATYSTARTLDATTFAKLPAMGSAYQRAWECSITANTRARVEAFDIGKVRVGS